MKRGGIWTSSSIARLHARVARVSCPDCGVRKVATPWARAGSGTRAGRRPRTCSQGVAAESRGNRAAMRRRPTAAPRPRGGGPIQRASAQLRSSSNRLPANRPGACRRRSVTSREVGWIVTERKRLEPRDRELRIDREPRRRCLPRLLEAAKERERRRKMEKTDGLVRLASTDRRNRATASSCRPRRLFAPPAINIQEGAPMSRGLSRKASWT